MFKSNIRTRLREAKAVQSEYVQSVTRQNYWALFIPAIACIIIQSVNLVRIFHSNSRLNTLNNRIYFAFYLSMFLFTIAIVILQEYVESNTNILYYVQLSCVVFYLIWNALLNWYQVHKGHQSTFLVFITAFMGALVIIHLRLKHSIIIILCSSLFIITTGSFYLDYTQINNLLISVIVALIMVITYFFQKVDSIIYQREIAQMNQLLKQEKEQLRISSEKQVLIMDELHLFYFEWDIAEDYLLLSSHCAKQFQCHTYIPSPKSWFRDHDNIHSEDLPKLIAVFESHLQLHAPNILELRIKDSEGMYAWYRLRLDTQVDDSKTPISIVGSLQNIEEIRLKHSQINQRILDQMEGTEGYFKYLRATQEKVLLYHHDMRHTLRLIDQLIAQEDLDALKSHTQFAQEKLESIAPKLYCDHNIINLILGSFEQMCMQEQVTLTSRVQLPKSLPFTSLTLCTLYFNLLENALFAASGIDDTTLRNIEIHSYINNQKLVITVQNSYAGTVLFEDGLPRPSVSMNGHGLGIQSVVDSVDACDGMYLFKTEGQIFIAKLLLPLG